MQAAEELILTVAVVPSTLALLHNPTRTGACFVTPVLEPSRTKNVRIGFCAPGFLAFPLSERVLQEGWPVLQGVC
jgi:hypothetical protein